MEENLIFFGGVSLSHNPKTLKVTRKNSVKGGCDSYGKPYESAVFEDVEVISGEGELYGRNCAEDLMKLKFFMQSRREAVLSMPHFGSLKAVLTSLSYSASCREGCIGVGFEFRRVHTQSHAAADCVPEYTAEGGESLWDISYNFSIPIEKLTELNCHIRDIMSLEEGEAVRLC